MKNVIYRIRNVVNDKFYVGSTNDSHVRFQAHRRRLKQGKHQSPHLQAAWNKYGEDCFRFEIIEQLDEQEGLLAAEQVWLDKHAGKSYCYNWATDASAPMRGRRHTPEVVELLKKAAQKVPKGEASPLYGKKHSEEFKKKSSLTKKGKRSYNEEQFEKQNKKTPKGETHPNWKGGTSNQPYPFEFNKILKEDIKKRDDFMCGICGKETQKLAIHHIDYQKNNIKFDNLISLCYSCHSKTNYNRDCWVEFFNKKININK